MTNQKGDGDHVVVDPEIYRDCPGCGGQRIQAHTYYETTRAFIGIANVQYMVRCGGCRAHTKWFTTPEKAIAAWNLRPEGEPQSKGLSVREMRKLHGISDADRKGSREEIDILSGKRFKLEED